MFDRGGSFRKLSDFSSDIAHELRTAVSNLMMQTQFALAKKGMFRITAKSYSLTEELKRLSRMTSDMLFLARSEHGLLQLDKHDVDLAAELNELRELFEPLADETGKTITLKERALLPETAICCDVLSVTCFPMQSSILPITPVQRYTLSVT
ncbi:histidine kinase dimerization/phospho-acceptor domain-containing protein [Enterobacter hormaechei]|uniref:histidine kinase dimerization/phospho-acceptor domain-containing protein n=1 Tax=Enterobacter hormaechei TaxID=158836 RepID=UPI001F60621A|nr:histidine kinase dimerization/phospho-acceptor domain-containing protein [Enterobacter hormaechei]